MRKSKNVTVNRMEESDDEKLQEKVEEALEKIGERTLLKDCVRLGVKKADYSNPFQSVKLTLNTSDNVSQVLRNGGQLHAVEEYRYA